MPANLDIPDVHVLLAAEGTLHLDSPQSEADMAAAVTQALEAVTRAYRVPLTPTPAVTPRTTPLTASTWRSTCSAASPTT
ncbi:hypothetical protein RB201_04370 [Streptomyces sp. S1A(2023)]